MEIIKFYVHNNYFNKQYTQQDYLQYFDNKVTYVHNYTVAT